MRTLTDRRRATRWACGTWLLVLPVMAFCAVPSDALDVRQIAEGIYVHTGLVADPSTANHGDVANLGFVVGTACVAVIDSGETLALGRALRAAIARVTTVPICYVINSHVHPDHVFGNAAFIGDTPRFVGHARLAAALAARGEHYRRALERDLGDEAAGSVVVPPTLEVRTDTSLDLGGRTLRLTAWPPSHTDNDLTIVDERTGTWWLADLLFVDHVPVVDGSLRGWLVTLAALRAMPAPRHVVPGHGPVDAPWPASLDAQQRYLERLAADVRAALAAGRSMQQAVDAIEPAERERWQLLDSFHRRNVTAAFAELEWEE